MSDDLFAVLDPLFDWDDDVAFTKSTRPIDRILMYPIRDMYWGPDGGEDRLYHPTLTVTEDLAIIEEICADVVSRHPSAKEDADFLVAFLKEHGKMEIFLAW